MNSWEIKIDNHYDVEFYQDGNFVLGSNTKSKVNPFVLEFKFYDRIDEHFITIKETQHFFFWYRYKLIYHNFSIEKLNISNLHIKEFSIGSIKFDCKSPKLPGNRIVTFYKNNSELGFVKWKGILNNNFEMTLHEESNYNLYFCIIACIYIHCVRIPA